MQLVGLETIPDSKLMRLVGLETIADSKLMRLVGLETIADSKFAARQSGNIGRRDWMQLVGRATIADSVGNPTKDLANKFEVLKNK